MLIEINPFRVTTNKCKEYLIALRWWPLSMKDIIRDKPEEDHALIEVYHEWIWEFFIWDTSIAEVPSTYYKAKGIFIEPTCWECINTKDKMEDK